MLLQFLCFLIIGPTLASPVSVSSSPLSLIDQQPRRRTRRPRTVYTPDQLASMESVFTCNQHPDINSREALADALNLTEAHIRVSYTFSFDIIIKLFFRVLLLLV